MIVRNLIRKYGSEIAPYLANIGVNLLSNGNVYFVDNENTNALNANNGVAGNTYAQPFSTLNYAISRCTADQGDVIIVGEKHTETIDDAGTASGTTTDELVVDKAGISIIGIGRGRNRPTFTLGSADTTAACVVTAGTTNVLIKNLRFVSGLADVGAAITLTATSDGAIIEDCEFRDGNAANLELVDAITIAADCDDVVIRNCVFSTVPSGGCASAIVLAGGSDRIVIEGNVAQGTYSNAVVSMDTAASTEVIIRNNIFTNQGAACLELHASCTGVLANNYLAGTTSIAAALTGENLMWCFENYATGADASSAIIDPAVDAD